MKNIYLIIIVEILIIYSTFAQSFSQANIIPPSPNAQTFQKYGNYPVSLYTGITNINLPIYEINLKDISIPISLSYNSSGIKVNEEAGRVGLGWTLNAGGLISHTIMGLDDIYDDTYKHKGYYFTSSKNTIDYNTRIPYSLNSLPDLINIGFPSKNAFNNATILNHNLFFFNPNTNVDTLRAALKCELDYDLQPDIYNYNFSNYSGKYIMKHNYEIINEKDNNIEIKLIKTTVMYAGETWSWLVVTPEGDSYYFNQIEKLKAQNNSQNESISAWYLTKIITSKGTEINFKYNTSNNVVSTYNNTYQDTYSATSLSPINRKYEIVSLDEIEYPLGKVKFYYSNNRIDLANELQLDSIKVFTNNYQTNSFKLNYGYFNANSTSAEFTTVDDLQSFDPLIPEGTYTDNWKNKRLKLISISKLANNILIPLYQMEYKEDKLPSKLVGAKDHWGYYNGADLNNSLLPEYTEDTNIKRYLNWWAVSQFTDTYPVIGGSNGSNREPSTDNKNQAYILKSIKYPTGGKTVFNYESNKYSTNNFEGDLYKKRFYYRNYIKTIKGAEPGYVVNAPWVEEQILTPDEFYNVKIVVETEYTADFNGISIWNYSDTAYISILMNGGFKVFNKNFIRQVETDFSLNYSNYDSNTHTYKERKIFNVTLPYGYGNNYVIRVGGRLRYFLKKFDVSTLQIQGADKYLQDHPLSIGGGIRIKEIISYDKDESLLQMKSYEYTSGKLMLYPRYTSILRDQSIFGSNDYHVNYGTVSEGVMDSKYSVGYDSVSENTYDKFYKKISMTKFSYINKPDLRLLYTWNNMKDAASNLYNIFDANIPGILSFTHPENGTLVLKEDYDVGSNGTTISKVRELKYNYSILNRDTVWGINRKAINEFGFEFDNFINNGYDYTTNNLFTVTHVLDFLYPTMNKAWIRLDSINQTDFYKNGTKNILTTKMEYDPSYHLITKKRIINSSGIENSMSYIYPFNTTNPSNAVIELKNKNRLNEIVTLIQENNGIKQIKENEYAVIDNLIEKTKIKLNSGLNRELEVRTEFLNYDTKGNLLFVKNDLIGTVYLWSYKHQYPIAEIKNATFTEVENVVKTIFSVVDVNALSALTLPNEAKLKDGSLQRALPNALVTTYTYKPLIGIVTMTDPRGVTTTYSYDDFNRLQNVKDLNSKILQSFDYNYKH